MPRRQIVLLVIMAAAVAYGAYTLLGADKAADVADPHSQAKLEEMAQTVREAVDKERLSQLETYRLSRVQEGAVGDPFLRTSGDESGGEGYATATDEDGRFVYNGMISLGGTSFAVVNDSEYKVGESVGETGYILADIREDAVVLRGRDPQSGALQNLVVPIQDDLINFVEDGDAQ